MPKKPKSIFNMRDSKRNDLKHCWYRSSELGINISQEEELTVRAVSPFMRVGRHWVTTHKGRKKLYQWCSRFDPDTEDTNPDWECVGCELGMNIDEQIAFLGIVRHIQEESRKNPIRLIVIPSDLLKNVKKYAGKFKAEPWSEEEGFDFSLEYDAEATKNRWNTERGERSPLTEQELKYVNRLPSIEEVVADFSNPDVRSDYYNQFKSLAAMNMYYVTLKSADGYIDPDAPYASFKGDIDGTPWLNYPELVEYEQAFADTRKRKTGCPKNADASAGNPKTGTGKRGLKKRRSTDDDLNDAFGETPKAKRRNKKSSAEPSKRRRRSSSGAKKDRGPKPDCYADYRGDEDCLKCNWRKPCRKRS